MIEVKACFEFYNDNVRIDLKTGDKAMFLKLHSEPVRDEDRNTDQFTTLSIFDEAKPLENYAGDFQTVLNICIKELHKSAWGEGYEEYENQRQELKEMLEESTTALNEWVSQFEGETNVPSHLDKIKRHNKILKRGEKAKKAEPST